MEILYKDVINSATDCIFIIENFKTIDSFNNQLAIIK